MPRAKPLLFAARGLGRDPTLLPMLEALERWGVPVRKLELGPADDAARVVERARQMGESFDLGGFSLGARLAAEAARSLEVERLVLLGFPFHEHKRPEALTRMPLLEGLRAEVLIVQGARDPHGDRARLEGEALPAGVRIAWIDEGNHRFQPRAASGVSAAELRAKAAEAALAFLRPARGSA